MVARVCWFGLGLQGCFGLWGLLGLSSDRICWASFRFVGFAWVFSLSFNLLGLLSFNGLGCIDLRNLLSAILLACVLFLLGLFLSFGLVCSIECTYQQ